jgi:Na+/melibiose symporter-like transporter
MRICDIGIPMLASIAAIIIMMRFDITEDRAYSIRAEVERRRGERRSADSPVAEKPAKDRREKDRRGRA